MCTEDTLFGFESTQCLNPVAHAILCGVLIAINVLCIVKGVRVMPQIVPRAKQILGFYIATQVTSIVMEAFGLIFLKTDSTALRLFRLFLFSTFALSQYWGTIFRTEFFLETVANTQQYKTGRWTLIKLCLVVFLSIYTALAYTLLVVLPGTLPTISQRELSLRAAFTVAVVCYFIAMVLTALVGYRLLAVIRTVIELGLAQPARVATAKANLVVLREGMIKTMIAYAVGVAVLTTGVVLGMTWIVVHLVVFVTQLAFIGAVSYLETCKNANSKSKSKLTAEKSGHSHKASSTMLDDLKTPPGKPSDQPDGKESYAAKDSHVGKDSSVGKESYGGYGGKESYGGLGKESYTGKPSVDNAPFGFDQQPIVEEVLGLQIVE